MTVVVVCHSIPSNKRNIDLILTSDCRLGSNCRLGCYITRHMHLVPHTVSKVNVMNLTVF